MKAIIEIKMDNAAFHSSGPADEVAWILQNLVNEISTEGTKGREAVEAEEISHSLRDSYGNTVGHLRVDA